MSFKDFLNEGKFDKYLDQIPEELKYEVTKDGLKIFHKSGKPLMFIANKFADKTEGQIKSIKQAMKTSYFERTEFKDLGDLDWDKHGDGF